MVHRHSEKKLLHFLHHELELSRADIAVALRRRELDHAPIPMLLWQYGFINLDQLERIFDWLVDDSENIYK
jgi:hypothetical protein